MEFLKLARGNLIFFAFMAVMLGGCSLLDPYVDRIRDAGAPPEKLYIGKSTKEKPSICYNLLTTDYKTVKKMADEECRKHKTGYFAEPISQESFTCKILIPARVNFKCVR